MPTIAADRRRPPRHPVQLPLLHKLKAPAPPRTGTGWTHNLSEGSACVELDERVVASTPLQVCLQTERGAIEVEAQVVWEVGAGRPGAAEGGILHGVLFTHLAPDQLQALRDLLLSRRGERRAGLRLPTDLVVKCRPRGQADLPLQGRTEDLGRGGLLLRLTKALAPGTALELTLHPPSGPVTAEGEIVWAEPPEKRKRGEPIRHGVRFTALGWSQSLSLALVLSQVA
ncbi:MAG: PilZ domain-containing protein [Candidatus Methylomirabilales bacterium]